jgi:predicted Zn-dependent protease
MPETNPIRTDRTHAAIAAWHAGRVDEAISALRDLVAEDLDDVLCLYLLGGYLWHAGRAEDGVPHLKRAVALQPRHRPATETLFNALWETGARSEAVDVLRRFLELQDVEEIAQLLKAVEAHAEPRRVDAPDGPA